MKKISIKDIARRGNVSATTVSFVLNSKAKEKRISEIIEKRIITIARDLNYHPNHLARGLRTGSTKTMGLIIEDISNSFFSGLAKAVEDEADKYGYKVFYCSTENNTLKAKELLHLLKNRQVDAFIITPTQNLEQELAALKKENKPFVLVDRFLESLPTNYVVVNNFQSAHLATSYLIAEGYRKIGVVTLNSEQVQMKDRLKGYLAAMLQHQLPQKQAWVKKIPFETSREDAVKEISDWIKINRDLEAVFFTTNYLGIYGLESVRLNQLLIPEDIGMICYDDNDIFRLSQPTVNVVAQPVQEIGQQAVYMLIQELEENRSPHSSQIILSGELIIRHSCRNLNDSPRPYPKN
ncbi:MAG: LacI family DNA-binding transcriptional regulator [Chitinophagaceae bacterium]